MEENKTTIANAVTKLAVIKRFCKEVLIDGTDYGTIPYAGKKKVLLKSGAEKLATLLQVTPEFVMVNNLMDYEKNLFHFHYTCRLMRDGKVIAEADGLATSKEKKWNRTPFDYSVVNTLCKIAQKRAFVAAVLLASCASELFTQDLEDH